MRKLLRLVAIAFLLSIHAGLVYDVLLTFELEVSKPKRGYEVPSEPRPKYCINWMFERGE